MTIIETKLQEIADCISAYIYNPETGKDTGLYTGTIGMLMFMTYYNRLSGKTKYSEISAKLLDECCESICNGIYNPSFCGGVSGMLYGLKHLDRFGFIDIDLQDVHMGYVRFLRSSLKAHAENGNFDFMHEATGIALYLLQEGTQEDLSHISEFVRILDSKAKCEGDSLKWQSNVYQKQDKVYNISLSHGMSSICVFLSQCLEKEIELEITRKLLNGVVNYILQQELDYLKSGSFFPSLSIESNFDDIFKSRMGWCYGDLGIATALWRAGIVSDNFQWKEKAIEIMEYATNRRDLESENIDNAGICHGTAGIAQIFRRMYFNTGNEKFLKTARFWIVETLKMKADNNKENAGFKVFSGNNNGVRMYDFLEGIAGVGLSLMASLGEEHFSTWDKIVLLS